VIGDRAIGRGLGCDDGCFEVGCVLLSAVEAAVGAIELATIAVRHADVGELFDHRQIDLAALLVARDRKRAERGTVVALLAAEDLVAIGLADLDLVLTREFEGGFNGLGSAACEVNSAAAEVGTSEGEQFFRVLFGHRRCELAGVDKLKVRCLFRHSRGDFADAVSDEVDGGGAGEVEVAIAGRIPEVYAFPAHGGREVFEEGAAKNGGSTQGGGHREII